MAGYATKWAVALIAIILVTSAHAQMYDQCMGYFGQLGGQAGVAQQLPSCGQGMGKMGQCCQEMKNMVNAGPAGCLCDAQVWDEVVKQVEAANIPNINENTLNLAMRICGINHARAGC